MFWRRGWLVLALLACVACGGPSLVVVGEAIRPPDPLLVIQVVDGDGVPVANAPIVVGEDRLETDDAGTVGAEWRRGPVTVETAVPGFYPRSLTIAEFPETPVVELILRSVVLRGVVTDERGLPVASARVTTEWTDTITDEDGTFRLERALPGPVEVRRAGWMPTSVEWSGEGDLEVALQSRVVKALYATGSATADQAVWETLLRTAGETEVNGMVVDLKDSSGTIFYDSQVELARQAGSVRPAFDVAARLAELEDNDLYAIARVVAFEDPVVANAVSDLAVWDTVRQAPWRNDAGRAWLDPTDPGARAYLIELAKEVCRLGFDEVQFDYVRFPTDGPLGQARFDGGYSPEVRMETISGFLQEARAALHEEGCAVAADIFGFVTRATDEGNIGQRVEVMAGSVDVLSPMIYPSHYSSGWYGFEIPNDHPAEVVGNAVDDALARIQAGHVMRPWLQAFSFGPGISYGPNEVRAQIDQVESRGMGWMLWNAGSRFDARALRPADQ